MRMTARILPLAAVLAAACGMPTPDTPLGLAADAGDVVRIQALVSHGADPNGFTNFGLTPLVIAARRGHVDAVRALLAAHADPNLRDSPPTRPGWTPLMNAVHKDQLEVVLTLLQAGADPNARSTDGNCALRLASSGGVSEALVKAGATKGS